MIIVLCVEWNANKSYKSITRIYMYSEVHITCLGVLWPTGELGKHTYLLPKFINPINTQEVTKYLLEILTQLLEIPTRSGTQISHSVAPPTHPRGPPTHSINRPPTLDPNSGSSPTN